MNNNIKFKIPLLRDCHHHPSVYTSLLHSYILAGKITDKNILLKNIDDNQDDITSVAGWDCTKYNLDKEDLNHFNKPVLVCNRSFHRYIVNDIFKEKLYDKYGDIVINLDKQHWAEKNIFNIMKFLVNIKPFTIEQLEFQFNDMLNNYGIWYAEDMMLPDLKTLYKYKVLDYIGKRTNIWVEYDIYQKLNKEEQQLIKGIKVFLDGAFGSYAAAIKEPYLDRPSSSGFLNYTNKEVKELLENISYLNKPVAFHNVGDNATDQILDILELIEKNNGKKPKRIRIEHNVFISRESAIKAKKLHITLCMQPNFNYDTIRFNKRISKDYTNKINPFRMLIDDIQFKPGIDLIFGSDGMPQGILDSINKALFPPLPSQYLSLEEFQKGYCVDNFNEGYINLHIKDNYVNCQININKKM